MKRSVQILLLFACLAPLLAGAREETMEERKRRITRKYLRERMDITYSDMVVPDSSAEDEEVLASERFKEPQVNLQRQEPGVSRPLPPPRRAAPRAENSNWLLAEEPGLDDPYANPFARKKSEDEPKKKADWTAWGTERSSSPYTGTQRESRFNFSQRGYGSSTGQQPAGYESVWGGSSRDSSGSFGEDFQQQGSVWGSSSLFGRQQDPLVPGTTSGLDLSRDKTFNSTLNQTRLKSPFPHAAGTSEDRSFGSGSQSRTGGYVPYKSPYQTQREQRQQQGGYGDSTPEYQKPNTFQQWKKKNPSQFDPTSNDAFINEMMPKTRR